MKSKNEGPICMFVDCGSDEIECLDDGSCVDREWLCDGEDDCDDGTDELLSVCKTQLSTSKYTCQAEIKQHCDRK